MQNIEFEINAINVAVVTLNRPNIHNAFDEITIAELMSVFDIVNDDNNIRALILRASGKTFSAGADINWMKKMASYSQSENEADALQLGRMLHKLYTLNKPTIARVQGAAYGGALGIIACCDIAVGSKLSKFCLSEAKFGLLPATIAPYVVKAIGVRESKRLFMTAEVISARRARRLGLLSEIVSESELDSTIGLMIGRILKNGPRAVSQAKALALMVDEAAISEELMEKTSKINAVARTSEEGQEGLSSFLSKRDPSWLTDV